MKTMARRATVWAVVIGVAVVAAGCGTKPGPVKVDGRVLKFLAVDTDDPTEVQTVAAMEAARLNYDFRLTVLDEKYREMGMIEGYQKVDRELENLREAQWFCWEGLPEIDPPQQESLDGVGEALLVEYTTQARNDYVAALNDTIVMYRQKGDPIKIEHVERVKERLDLTETYGYLEPIDVPPPDLRPEVVDSRAEAIYARALKLHKEGKLVPLFPDRRKQRRALELFLTVVREYPSSTRIAESAFYIAEIYKEYRGQNWLAVRWYERAWQWDPAITHPARFQAAVIYDLRLHQRKEAIELYKQVIQHERHMSWTNTNFAYERIEKLQEELSQQR